MDVWDVLASCRRRWLVLLLGLATTAASLLFVAQKPGVFWAQMNLILLAPPSARYPNSLGITTESLIMTAGLIMHDVNEGDQYQATSSAKLTLVDEGIRDGELVRLPNWGGQWADNYSVPLLDIQAVAADPDVVRERMLNLQAEVMNALKQRQDEAGADATNRITIYASPSDVEVKEDRGHRSRALAVTAGLGICVSMWLAVVADRERLGVLRSSGTDRKARAVRERRGLDRRVKAGVGFAQKRSE